MKNKFVILIYFLLLILIGIGSFKIPEYYLDRMKNANILVVQHGENTYYGEDISYEDSGIATVEMQLPDKIRLINGMDKRSEKVIDEPDQDVLSKRDAINNTREKLTQLFKMGLMPLNMDSSIDDWYSCKGTLYEYKDKTFGKYVTQVWIIEYTAYDNNTQLKIIVDAQTGSIYDLYITSQEGLLDTSMFNDKLANTMYNYEKYLEYILGSIINLLVNDNKMVNYDINPNLKDDEKEVNGEKEYKDRFVYADRLSDDLSQFAFYDITDDNEYSMYIVNEKNTFRIFFKILY